MTQNKNIGHKMLEVIVGSDFDVIINDYNEIDSHTDKITSQQIVFQFIEDEPDLFAFDLLFTLGLMSYIDAQPVGISHHHYNRNDEWGIEKFLKCLRFERGNLIFSSDYIDGRMMKTDIQFKPGGKVTLSTQNRGRIAEHWLMKLQKGLVDEPLH
ncbi:MAG: hypothetical protein U5L00_19970 [Desulfovermiculus sp.]|nr:hypothetical protein [Desulfovermiculus sp.]